MEKTLFLIISVLLLFSLFSCGPRTAQTVRQSTYVEEDGETAASADVLGRDVLKWEEAFPLQAADNNRNHTEQPSPTGYNGSEPIQRWEWTPEIKTNFSGIAFSKDYKEDRGHVYAWEDIFETVRTSEKSPGACITCKTSDIDLVFDEYGWDYASMKMYDFEESAHSGIDCFSCHDPETKHLRVTQPAFIEAMAMRGTPVNEASEQEMKTNVCAQCHSEYYFEPGTTKVIFPWQNGLSPEEMYSYYQEEPSGFTGDYTNPVSGVRLVKAQHPDYETYQSGIHASVGISCAQCHMPKTWSEEGEQYTQHWITSPLHTIESSCLSCHKGKTEQWITDRVQYIQDTAFDSMRRAGLAIEEAHKTIGAAAAQGVSDSTVNAAQDLLREAQWYWDFSASANSMGFHNSELVHSNYSTALDLAHKSIQLILKAL
ncbi:MAG: ammonia-forming cytochrome c nitrite reductase subunit c552 [Spirochaetales bacterium]|nr:ammonia-forming cytochrome c nitrite reductase subunit c552 [Spirochaetales bacterium]